MKFISKTEEKCIIHSHQRMQAIYLHTYHFLSIYIYFTYFIYYLYVYILYMYSYIYTYIYKLAFFSNFSIKSVFFNLVLGYNLSPSILNNALMSVNVNPTLTTINFNLIKNKFEDVILCQENLLD